MVKDHTSVLISQISSWTATDYLRYNGSVLIYRREFILMDNKRKSIREKKALLIKEEIIRVEQSPATKKINALNRLVLELFQ